MSQPNQNNTNPDHKNTKIFVGGLTWRTTSHDLKSFFGQFGEILDANVVCETYPGRSKGYGFVVFKDAETATKVCKNEFYDIDGRKANVNLAYLRAKNNNNNQSCNQNGSMNHARPVHHYETIPLQNPCFYPLQYYWNSYYRQYFPNMCHALPQHYPTPMINYYGSTTQNYIVMPRSRPVRISAPERSSVRLENIEETNQEDEVNVVARQENNEETVKTQGSDLEQEEANDQGESIGLV